MHALTHLHSGSPAMHGDLYVRHCAASTAVSRRSRETRARHEQCDSIALLGDIVRSESKPEKSSDVSICSFVQRTQTDTEMPVCQRILNPLISVILNTNVCIHVQLLLPTISYCEICSQLCCH